MYKGHPIGDFIRSGISVVGQIPENVDLYDDKLVTNELLRTSGLPIPKFVMITAGNMDGYTLDFPFPVVAKPIRGRGSQGVSFVKNSIDLNRTIHEMFNAQSYGAALYVEEFLAGQEITVTVMPPGEYTFKEKIIVKNNYWSLPPVKRFNHLNGIAPFNGTVAIINNSKVLSDMEWKQPDILQLCEQRERAAELVQAKAPIRIDCRANVNGDYYLSI